MLSIRSDPLSVGPSIASSSVDDKCRRSCLDASRARLPAGERSNMNSIGEDSRMVMTTCLRTVNAKRNTQLRSFWTVSWVKDDRLRRFQETWTAANCCRLSNRVAVVAETNER